ncbi:MAG: hypothetical protein AAFY88_07035 [Acidobacteriota bacterium]
MALGGCTVVEISAGEGAVEVERHFGALSFDWPENEATVVRIRTFGAGPTLTGFALGYAAADAAILNRDCRVVLWLEPETDLDDVRAAVRGIPDVCIAGPGAKRNGADQSGANEGGKQ